MRYIIIILLGIISGVQPVYASPVIMELFTSQSCEECPEADELLQKISQKKPYIITLSCNIDYWNYKDWADTLSKSFCTRRQLDYSMSGGRQGKLDTPELIVNGNISLKGTRFWEVSNTLARNETHIAPIELELRNEDELILMVPSISLNKDPATISLLLYSENQTVPILKGVNRGKKLTYVHPVQSIDILHNKWDGKGIQTTIFVGKERIRQAAGLVVMVQQGPRAAGKILAAGRLKLK